MLIIIPTNVYHEHERDRFIQTDSILQHAQRLNVLEYRILHFRWAVGSCEILCPGHSCTCRANQDVISLH